MMYRRILLCVLLFGAPALFTAPAYGSCDIGSLYESIDWHEVTHDWYSICYTTEYEEDVAFVERWVAHAWQLMRDKYGVARFAHARDNRALHLFVVLLPAPNADASTGTTRFQCCYDASGAYTSYGTFARIPYLTPSHPEWATRPVWGGMQLPAADYHAKNLVHEVTHAGQHSIYGGRRPRQIPAWVSEGLAEYEGMFNATEHNRTVGFATLVRYVRDTIPDRVFYGQTLASGDLTLSTSDVYFGGSLILKYFAEAFGEDLHVRLVRHAHPTFIEALADEFAAARTTVPEVFQGLRTWLESGGVDVDLAERTFNLHFAHSAVGGGWRTDLVLLNPHRNKKAEAAVEIFGSDGTPRIEKQFNLLGLGVTEWALPAGEEIEAGGVVVSSPEKLSGFLRFRHEGGAATSVQAAPVADAFVVPASSEADQTGLAVYNADDEDLTVVLRMGERTLYKTIPAQGKIAGFVDEYFPGLDEPTGVLIVQTDPPGGQITVLALELINGNLVTLPAAALGVEDH